MAGTVLLIEDEALIRMATTAMLEDAGYIVLEAGTADEATQILFDHPEIAIVVTDVRMPGAMDGLALTDLIQDQYPKIHVLITSGLTGNREARTHGAAVFLPKPYTAAAIQTALHELC